MFFQTESENVVTPDTVKIGRLSFSLRAFYISIVGAVITVIASQRSHRNMYLKQMKNIFRNNSKNKKSTLSKLFLNSIAKSIPLAYKYMTLIQYKWRV
jgi:hypothetical protein